MKITRNLTLIVTSLGIVSCGGGSSNNSNGGAEQKPPIEAPTVTKNMDLVAKQGSSKAFVSEAEIQGILAGNHTATWAYFKDADSKFWYISDLYSTTGIFNNQKSNVFALGAIENNNATWWNVADGVGLYNPALHYMKIDNIAQTTSNQFYQLAGSTRTDKVDNSIVNFRAQIQNDNVPVGWYFFRAANAYSPFSQPAWYIASAPMFGANPTIMRFGLNSAATQYEWENINVSGYTLKYTPKMGGVGINLYKQFEWVTALPNGATLDSSASEIYKVGFSFLADTGSTYTGCSGSQVTRHPGIDVNVLGTAGDGDLGTEIRSPSSGIVRGVTNTASVGGLTIEHKLEDGTSVWSAFRHLQPNMQVLVGDSVTKGQVVANLGKSGTTAAHLHYELRTASHPDPSNSNYWCGYAGQSLNTLNTWLKDPLVFIKSRK